MRILQLSDSAFHTTGYASQTRLLGRTLVNSGHDFYQIGHNYQGSIIKQCTLEDGEDINFTMLPGDGSPYASKAMPDYFMKYQPDVFFILLDTFMLKQVNFPQWNVPAKSIFWYPSDGGWFPKFCQEVLTKIDYPVAMAKWGQDQTKRLFNIKSHYIPHGVRTENYFPFSEEKKLSNRAFFENGGLFAFKNLQFYPVKSILQNKFIVGCVSRNQGRKNLPETIKGFCKFAEGKEDVMLIMHSDPVDYAAVCNLQDVADRWGQGHKVLWTGMRIGNPYSVQRMNQLYNLFDAFYLTTTGEGFGVPFIEAMACEVPVIATDYTTTKEIITDNNAGLGIKLMGEDQRPYPPESKIFNGTITGTWEVDRAFADYYDSVAKLQWAYDNREQMKKMGINGKKAVMRYYDWNTRVGPEWIRFMEEITK